MAAVVPKCDCPHVSGLNYGIFMKKPINVDAVCEKEGCDAKGENWICCFCGNVMCSRYIAGHAAEHVEKNPDHCIAVSFADCSCWCYKCDSYIEDPVSLRYINAVVRAKFGEPAAKIKHLDDESLPVIQETVKSVEGEFIEFSQATPKARLALCLENCNMCVLNVTIPLHTIRFIGCKKCTVYISYEVRNIEMSNCEEMTIRQCCVCDDTNVKVEGTNSLMIALTFAPDRTFYSNLEASNTTVGITSPTVNTVIPHCARSAIKFDKEALKFVTTLK